MSTNRLVGHLARRGVEHVYKRATTQDDAVNAWENEDFEWPPFGTVLISATGIIFLMIMVAISYTLEHVITNLTMIETPTVEVAIENVNSSLDEPDAPLEKQGLLDDVEKEHSSVTLIPQRPITSKIRTTLRHLTSQAGYLSRFRGFSAFIFFALGASTIEGLVQTFLSFLPLGNIIASVVAFICMARIHMAWTHITISMPSDKPWYRRIPPMSSFRHVWVPAAIYAASYNASVYIIGGSAYFFGCHNVDYQDIYNDYEHSKGALVFLNWLAFVLISISTYFFIVLPAHTTYIRVEASLLPESEDPIVPFDRSFGGKVVPAVAGGTGAVGFIEAWRSFKWEARRRLIKLDVKIFFIAMAITFIFVHIILFEFWAIMGDSLGAFVSQLDMQNMGL
ncbi:hypothetical protein M501DRAFT_1015236 [Patellaria atrata CBS 101060]|uniref:Uncharacterized protein n=1 Tax=Patellaria atrata CBS 101060 TaxID=1346257 RepID=A0A9P4SCX2_9PEZI|nr:hypothetical protein M501DRAFT_1015236 [Patellaria atrata CBS 101060]